MGVTHSVLFSTTRCVHCMILHSAQPNSSRLLAAACVEHTPAGMGHKTHDVPCCRHGPKKYSTPPTGGMHQDPTLPHSLQTASHPMPQAYAPTWMHERHTLTGRALGGKTGCVRRTTPQGPQQSSAIGALHEHAAPVLSQQGNSRSLR